ncbi:DUF4169 family protein [Novosphingobium sp. ZN18A2]|uniref:DUF4169 family protein n=1 Tax=Novosphingobium sp. ZN18A2 TaxID=3079861 RepID=UPI0030CCDC3E
MAEIVNLRMARKTKRRNEAQARAEENRAKHGAGKAERTATRLDQARDAARIDGARRERED